MLTPDQRALFLEALRPPEGYHFDRGIGTTFTLDLLTLLIAPLSLALLNVEDAEDALRDPVLLLEGVRRCAGCLVIFCQAGRIAIPRKDSYLYRFLEQTVVEVQAPRGGVFHPKLWLLRYLAEDGEQPPLYRLLNLTRNLTFDKSWDLMLRLEGYLAMDRQRAYARNHPLGDFVQQLPDMALHPPAARILQDIDLLQDEVRRVDFQTPKPFFDELGFYPAGIPGRRAYRFKGRCDRALVISPFLSDRLLRRVTGEGTSHVLISRPDSIAALKPKTRAAFDRVYVLHDVGLEEEETDVVEDVGEEIVGAQPEPLGLHAKLFVVEAGWDATWLIGSANATDAAFSRRNVEFMVELKGRKHKIGIAKIFGGEEENTLFSLLRAYTPRDTEVETDEKKEQAERMANDVRDWLLALEMRLEVKERREGEFDLSLHAAPAGQEPLPPGEFTVNCWPVSLRPEQGHALTPSSSFPLVFSGVSRLALTTFVAFEVATRIERRKHTLRFALNLPIVGLPQDRRERIFSAILSDRAQFLRYLRILLADREDGSTYWMEALGTESEGKWRTWPGGVEMPLLGALVRALSRSPEKIARIAEIVESLQRTPEGREVLPEGFQLLWDAVMHARSEVK